jgi:hypothetical protein
VAIWKPGQSGNPSGKRPGTRHRATVAVEQLLAGEAKALTRKAIELALDGDTTALRLCLDRVAPVRRGGLVRLALPEITTPTGVAAAVVEMVAEVAAGRISPEEAAAVGSLLNLQGRMLELHELEQRIAALEAKHEPS